MFSAARPFERPTVESGLSNWFALWHPRYRSLIIQLFLVGTLAAGMVYAQNALLTSLTLSLGAQASPSGPAGAAGAVPPGFLPALSESLQLSLPLFILALFILAQCLSAFFEYWRIRVTGALRLMTRNDLEVEILTHLLGKEDAFFALHSPAETVNRITVDLNRVCELRCHVMRVWCSSVLLLSYFVFFLLKDWRMGLAAICSCAAAAFWSFRMTRRIKHLDRDFLHEDDRVKSQFEDFLRAAPEVQVGNLCGKVRRALRACQKLRSTTTLRFVRLSGILNAGDSLSSLLAIVTAILVVMVMKHTGEGRLALALLPVVVMALPTLFLQASNLIFLNVDFQLAFTSRDRLLEYETLARSPSPQEDRNAAPGSSAGHDRNPETPRGKNQPFSPPCAGASVLHLQGVTYLYNNGGNNRQGGVAGIDAQFSPGRWYAIAGRAGSGKTTLVNLLLGRLHPQDGEVLYGGEPLTGPWRSSVFSLMPQSLALLNTTIRENLLFDTGNDGTHFSSRLELTESDFEVMESAGLGQICRLKALDMLPSDSSLRSPLSTNIAEVRTRARAYLSEAAGVEVRPYGKAHASRDSWLLEILLNGRCERTTTVQSLAGEGNEGKLRFLCRSPLGSELTELGRKLLRDTDALLTRPSFRHYSKAAMVCIEEPIWKLRSACAKRGEHEKLSQRERTALCVVALTCTPAELDDGVFPAKWTNPDFLELWKAETARIKDIVGAAWSPLSLMEINPYMTWRENLAFGITSRLPDRALLDFLEREGLNPLFTGLGLEFEVGRMGSNLSGGQGQLVALCRTLLRRTPVLVLDEPTSHLDPLSSARVARLLQGWRNGRIIITVSHDPGFVSRADSVFLMDGGRIAAGGSFEQILESSELFRKALKEE